MALKDARYEPNFDMHTNLDRTIVTLIKNIPEFPVGQVRIATLNRDASLGNHWREYPEIYGIIGQARITLEDIETKQRTTYRLSTGDRLFVPSEVALKMEAKKGTVIIVCAPEASRENQTHRYEFN